MNYPVDRPAKKDFGIWISIVTLGVGLFLTGIKAAASYGGLDQRVTSLSQDMTESKTRLGTVEKQYSDFAVLKETVRNMDIKLAEIKQLIQEQVRR